MAESVSLAGGCLCSAVRYRLDGPLLSCGICHCASCRRAAGAGSVGWLTVADRDFRLERGMLATYASSPGVTRGFCAGCGTSLTFTRDPGPSIDVTIASLDDPEAAAPWMEIWLSHRLSWTPANPNLPGFAESSDPAS